VRASVEPYPFGQHVLGPVQPSGPTGLLCSTLNVSQFLEKKTTVFPFPTDACDRRWRIHHAAAHSSPSPVTTAFSSVGAPHPATILRSSVPPSTSRRRGHGVHNGRSKTRKGRPVPVPRCMLGSSRRPSDLSLLATAAPYQVGRCVSGVPDICFKCFI
jgi:hypothetical protein